MPFNMIPHARSWITADDRAAVDAALSSPQLGDGTFRTGFEHALGEWLGAQPGIAFASGTSAMHAALLAVGAGPGTEILLPTYAPVGILDAVLATGATPVPADVGPSYVATPECVATCVCAQTRAIILPHVHGIFARPAAFKVFQVPVIEDFSEALGGDRHRPLQGDIGVFSFHPGGCLTTGDGGMVIASTPELTGRIGALCDRSPFDRRHLFPPLSDLAAALGLSQLRRYHEALVERRRLAMRYRACLEPLPVDVLAQQPVEDTMHFRFPITIPGGISAAHERFARQGVEVTGGIPGLVHRHLGLPDDRFPTAVMLFETTVSLPIYPGLDDAAFRRCADAALDVCGALLDQRVHCGLRTADCGLTS